MQDTILSTELRRHIKYILDNPSYINNSYLRIYDLISSLIANFEKNIELNKIYPDLKTKINDQISYNKKAWNDWCEIDRNRLPLKLQRAGLESKASIGQVTIKTTTGSKKELVKEIHRLQDLVNSLKK